MTTITLPYPYQNADIRNADVTQTMLDLYNVVTQINAAHFLPGSADGSYAITANSTVPALTINQTGTGHKLVLGNTTAVGTNPVAITPTMQLHGTANNSTSVGVFNWSSTGGITPSVQFSRSTSGTIGTRGVITPIGTSLGMIVAAGDDGVNFIEAARIEFELDATAGVNDMPGRMQFFTTPDGSPTTVERMRINNAGEIGIGPNVATTAQTLRVGKSITGATTAYGVASQATIAADVTTSALMFSSFPATAASAFTLTDIRHFDAAQGTIGAGSAVTNQYGFRAASSLTGATNNYAFYSNIAAASNRWNFYGAGTARSLLIGDLTVFGGTAIPAGGTIGTGIMVSSTANFGIFFGSGAPGLSAAKGSLYLRSDGSGVNDRMYVNTDGTTTWTAVVTVA